MEWEGAQGQGREWDVHSGAGAWTGSGHPPPRVGLDLHKGQRLGSIEVSDVQGVTSQAWGVYWTYLGRNSWEMLREVFKQRDLWLFGGSP